MHYFIINGTTIITILLLKIQVTEKEQASILLLYDHFWDRL